VKEEGYIGMANTNILLEYKSMNDSGSELIIYPPAEIRDSLTKFKADHEDPDRVAFVMMSFEKNPKYDEILNVIKESAASIGVLAIRADANKYHSHLYWNIMTYIYGCDLGVAVFDNISGVSFNPNIALEVGYMLALNKPVCMLK
jgi:hypothetical protein